MRDEFYGKTLIILGLARQGQALARFAASAGAHVVVSDLRPAEQLQEAMAALQDLDIRYVLGDHPFSLLDGADLLAISGGVAADLPIVREARRRAIPVTNDSREFMRRAPATVLGITGSAGKTTTTALTGAMAQASGRRTWIGGNIGRPLITDLPDMTGNDLVVQELSSFQLQLWDQSPPLAAVLNLTPNHLDRHASMQEYEEAKANILRFQSAEDVAVLSADDPGAMAMMPLVRGRLRTFSGTHQVADGAFIQDNHVWLGDGAGHREGLFPVSDVQLRGAHNLLNVCAAVTLADAAGVPVEAMVAAVRRFQSVAHRLEVVAELDGVLYVNDSIATAPERALAALAAFEEPIVLLAGGKDKNMVWGEWLRQVHKRVQHVILFGDLGPFLAQRLQETRPGAGASARVLLVNTLAEAVAAAREVAAPGDVVLLAPGGTSYDSYVDFAARGEHFRELVLQREGTHSQRENC